MSVVHGIPELECKDSVGAQGLELGAEFLGRESELVQAIVPADPLNHLQIAAQQPVTGLVDQLDEKKDKINILQNKLKMCHDT